MPKLSTRIVLINILIGFAGLLIAYLGNQLPQITEYYVVFFLLIDIVVVLTCFTSQSSQLQEENYFSVFIISTILGLLCVLGGSILYLFKSSKYLPISFSQVNSQIYFLIIIVGNVLSIGSFLWERITGRKSLSVEENTYNLYYKKLGDSLKEGLWKKANEQTVALMLKVSGREEQGWLDKESIRKFPCNELYAIDQLWAKYSVGRFGFSTQLSIWEMADKECLKLSEAIGWRKIGKWINYSELNFDLKAEEGHLPAFLLYGDVWQNNVELLKNQKKENDSYLKRLEEELNYLEIEKKNKDNHHKEILQEIENHFKLSEVRKEQEILNIELEKLMPIYYKTENQFYNINDYLKDIKSRMEEHPFKFLDLKIEELKSFIIENHSLINEKKESGLILKINFDYNHYMTVPIKEAFEYLERELKQLEYYKEEKNLLLKRLEEREAEYEEKSLVLKDLNRQLEYIESKMQENYRYLSQTRDISSHLSISDEELLNRKRSLEDQMLRDEQEILSEKTKLKDEKSRIEDEYKSKKFILDEASREIIRIFFDRFKTCKINVEHSYISTFN
ncbi:GUN4 domain-containing protein (plasmid) [Nostoc sp. UHCC 0302]|uniref:GUN4 domain-containing protein n=1 Tax=Nostoc sp. UHCC 0302 TaxID=3134896 RepID=UPI00311C8E57